MACHCSAHAHACSIPHLLRSLIVCVPRLLRAAHGRVWGASSALGIRRRPWRALAMWATGALACDIALCGHMKARNWTRGAPMHSLGPGRARRVGGWPPQGRDGFALFFVEFSFYAKYDLRSHGSHREEPSCASVYEPAHSLDRLPHKLFGDISCPLKDCIGRLRS